MALFAGKLKRELLTLSEYSIEQGLAHQESVRHMDGVIGELKERLAQVEAELLNTMSRHIEDKRLLAYQNEEKVIEFRLGDGVDANYPNIIEQGNISSPGRFTAAMTWSTGVSTGEFGTFEAIENAGTDPATLTVDYTEPAGTAVKELIGGGFFVFPR